jgi:hypothetical protein
MTLLPRTYPDETAARRAVEALRATGAADGMRLLTGRGPGDVRREPVGGFAGPIAPDAPAGTFAGRTVPRHVAGGGFAGDPSGRRQGSFGDSDRIVIVTFDAGRERARVTGLRGARRLLSRAGLADDAVNRAVRELHSGRAVVLADVRAQLERDAWAA